MTAMQQAANRPGMDAGFDASGGVVTLPGLLLFTKNAVREIARTFGIDPESDDAEELHATAVEGFDAVVDLRDSLANSRPDDPMRLPRWEAFHDALNSISYLLHNGRTHDGREIRFV